MIPLHVGYVDDYTDGPHTAYYGSESAAQAKYDSLPGSGTTGEIVGENHGEPVIYYTVFTKVLGKRISGYTTYTNYYSETTSNSYLNDTHGLGTGWSFMFSSIQSIQDSKYLHLADGRSLEIAITSTAGDSNLKDYTLTDLRIEQENGGYNNGSVSSTHTLYYKDGRKEYFSGDGKLIGIRDRYDNTIKFVHNSFNSQPRITITDTLGRVTTISSSAVTSGVRTVTVALPESITLKYTISTYTDSVTCSTLTKYADPMDIATNYGYSVSSGGFDVWSKSTSAATNYFMNLKTITHPTGTVSEYEYEAVSKNLGASGLQTSFRIKSRKDKIGETVYNEKTYAYSTNNNSGYPAQSDPSNLPDSFTYNTTVTTPHTSLSEKHTFNYKHLTTTIEAKHGTNKIQDKIFNEYYADKLPTKITTKTYDYTNNSNFMQSVDMMTYDGKGNVTASWSPMAGGDINDTEHKTTYTYDSAYSQLTSVSCKQDADTMVTKTYTLDSLGRHPVAEAVAMNGVTESITVWGYDNYGNRTTENCHEMSSDFDSIAAGYAHTLFISTDGTVFAWGYNAQGQLGNGTDNDSNTPVQVSELSNVINIAAGTYHSLALKSDGTVWTWGYNAQGQLGDGTDNDRDIPEQVSGLSEVISIAAGGEHSVALKSDGTVWAWGYNTFGQLGDGTTTNRNIPVQVSGLSGVISIATGGYHSVALQSDGRVWAWGDGNYGQLGDGSMGSRNIPVQTKGLSGVISVAAGYGHTLALKSDGTVWAWGYNTFGQLGDG